MFKMFSEFKNDLANEFQGYNAKSFKNDLMAGITVTAVALPLALAFGVSSGATAAAGLVTAIIAGIIIGIGSGGSFQISGPTGAMSAILILLSQQYGLKGVWIAGAIAGIILIISGIFKFGKIVSYIPTPVITGFTSGIALIIAIGQLDKFFGMKIEGSESAIMKVIYFFQGPFNPNWYAVLMGGLVVVTMIVWPKKWNAIIPSSLVGLILALGANLIFKLPVDVIGDIPKTLFLDDRLTLSAIDFATVKGLVFPAISIAALGMIESLLCGEVAKKMKNEKFDPNRELIAQGIGNFIIPFFGGVPATAAIARTSVGIKSGGNTRLVSILHGVFLLISMFILAPVMAQIPLAALAGILMVTSWRMNEWENIKYMFQKRFKSAISKFLITMIATVMFDLTQAILIGIVFASVLFIVKIANMEISINEVDEKRLGDDTTLGGNSAGHIKVAYFTGPLFFATVDKFKSELLEVQDTDVLILSMRGVPLIDTSGINALDELRTELKAKNCTLMLCGLQPQIKETMKRSGLDIKIGQEMIFWSADKAIVAADHIVNE